MTTLDTAAAAEIERLKYALEKANAAADYWESEADSWYAKCTESGRQRKLLVEQLERICRAGIEAAVGAGK